MPLVKSKSKKAFKENIKREIASGKPQKQAVAISFSVKRKEEHKESRMKSSKGHSKHHAKAEHHMAKAAHHHEKAKHHMEKAKHEAKERKLIGKLAKVNKMKVKKK